MRLDRIAPTALMLWALGLLTGIYAAEVDMSTRGNVPLELAAPVRLRAGQSARSPADRILITFDSVVEDSRCPQGVRCVWEGNAGIALSLKAPGGSAVVVLNTSTRFESRVSRLGFTIRLLEVSPLPEAEAPVAPADYMVTIEVTRP